MPSFLEDITSFYGTGERNASGQTLEEFLADYNPYKYKTPSCTADAVVFSYSKEPGKNLTGLKILLVKRSNHPSIGCWALPGGFIELEENLDDTAKRELKEETGVDGVRMEQLATYGDYNRDPRARVITTAYMALVPEDKVKVKAGDDAADAGWCEISLEQVSSAKIDGGIANQYKLHIINKEKGLDTCADVEEKLYEGLIREQHFTVKNQGAIAVDHAAIIVQAMVKMKERL